MGIQALLKSWLTRYTSWKSRRLNLGILPQAMTLNDEINALNGLLVKYQEQKWRLPTVQGKQDATRILSKMAGMGSLNDLYISAANGHNIAPSEEDAVNHLLRTHLAAIRHGCDSLLSQQG